MKYIILVIAILFFTASCKREKLPFKYLQDEYGRVYTAEIDQCGHCSCLKLTEVDTAEVLIKVLKNNSILYPK